MSSVITFYNDPKILDLERPWVPNVCTRAYKEKEKGEESFVNYGINVT